MDEKAKILEHLDNDFTEPVRDPVWGNIGLSRAMLRLVESKEFQKLGRIRQLGPTSLVYPGATHTRLSHSLGVFHIARRMIAVLVRRGAGPSVTAEGVKAFLCASLLHDIGHFPYAHSFKDLDVERHETLAARLVTEGPLGRTVRSELHVEPEAVAAIVDHRWPYGGSVDVGFFRGILSGVLDPDKLDYLNRDAYFCGVPYGIQDVDFVLEEVYPHPERSVAVSRKGLTALENVLFSKYLMYKTVYWHKTVRIATAMIKKAVTLALRDGALETKDLYWLDDEEFFAAFTAARHPAFRLVEDVKERRLYKQVRQVRFDEDDPWHRDLEDHARRAEAEESLAGEVGHRLGRKLPAGSVIIDVPERTPFEIDLPVIEPATGAPVPPREAVTVFRDRQREDFPAAIRSISINACRDEEVLAALSTLDPGSLPWAR